MAQERNADPNRHAKQHLTKTSSRSKTTGSSDKRGLPVVEKEWTDVTEGGDMAAESVVGTEHSGSTAGWTSQTDADLGEDVVDDPLDLGFGRVSTLLRGFGADMQKQLKVRSNVFL